MLDAAFRTARVSKRARLLTKFRDAGHWMLDSGFNLELGTLNLEP
jgi:hypothetical protein